MCARFNFVTNIKNVASALPAVLRTPAEEQHRLPDLNIAPTRVIPAARFHEWTVTKSSKHTWHIHRPDGEPMVMARLWESHDEFGETGTTFTIEPSK